jgi:hypothetical protein
MTSKSSKWQRGRRIVPYLTEVFRATPNTITIPKYKNSYGKEWFCDKKSENSAKNQGLLIVFYRKCISL